MGELQTIQLSGAYDYLAPDGSEIRLLPNMTGGGIAHCTLPPGGTSLAVFHKTVEEIWYFLAGEGEVWRKQGEHEEVVKAVPGLSLTIPSRTQFQFRNTCKESLCFVIMTMPPWPGPKEAEQVQEGYWTAAGKKSAARK